MESDPQHRGIFSNREKDREEKGGPVESTTPTTYYGVLYAHSANWNRCANIGQSERYDLHNPTDQRNLEGSEGEKDTLDFVKRKY